jgi:hypothetical protein
MARNITLTLGAGLGADLGPNFNLTANAGSVTPSTATKSELTAGKSVSVDDAANQITVTSTGTCANAITQTIPCATPSYDWLFHGGGNGFSTSAAALASNSGGPYRYSNSNAMIGNVTTFYTDTALTTPFNGGDLWYRVQLNGAGTNYAAFINSSGLVTTYTS